MKNKYLQTSLYAFLSAMLYTGNLLAKDDPVKEAIEYRQGAMSVIGWNFKPMGAMVKGNLAFDQKQFSALADDLAKAASLNLLAGYPEDSESDESKARAEVWLNWDDFKEKMADFNKAATNLAQVSQMGNEDASKKAFLATAKTCKACHKEYKAKKK
jgi:cytochrome c556